MNKPRRIAVALMDHASRILPSARAPWSQAMRSELHHIESDFEALTWSIGCVLASYVERSRAMTLIDTNLGRAFLALLILSQVLSMTFATALTAAWRLRIPAC